MINQCNIMIKTENFDKSPLPELTTAEPPQPPSTEIVTSTPSLSVTEEHHRNRDDETKPEVGDHPEPPSHGPPRTAGSPARGAHASSSPPSPDFAGATASDLRLFAAENPSPPRRRRSGKLTGGQWLTESTH
ncbi:unnamed protein product [Cochlearia groenlandica]